jgi:hypothetical protein
MSPAVSSWPTDQVVSAAQDGDPRAIATLVSGSHEHVRRFAHTLCSTPEDATQEALIVLYRKIGTLRATAALASWMFQIVRNECIRRSRLALRRPAPAGSVGPSAEEEALARLEMERTGRKRFILSPYLCEASSEKVTQGSTFGGGEVAGSGIDAESRCAVGGSTHREGAAGVRTPTTPALWSGRRCIRSRS